MPHLVPLSIQLKSSSLSCSRHAAVSHTPVSDPCPQEQQPLLFPACVSESHVRLCQTFALARDCLPGPAAPEGGPLGEERPGPDAA